jgi:hypothetical protein
MPILSWAPGYGAPTRCPALIECLESSEWAIFSDITCTTKITDYATPGSSTDIGALITDVSVIYCGNEAAGLYIFVLSSGSVIGLPASTNSQLDVSAIVPFTVGTILTSGGVDIPPLPYVGTTISISGFPQV